VSGHGHDQARDGSDRGAADVDTTPARGGSGTGTGTGTAKLRMMLVGGVPDPGAIAALLQAHQAEQAQMMGVLHASLGNSFVQSVIQLSPTAPPAPKTQTVPLATEEDLKAQADKLTAEQLLKTNTLDSAKNATQALDILLEVDEAHRGRVIDGIDDKAFENLLSRLNEADRVKLAKLVTASKNPRRKLLLWGEQHVGQAEGDLARMKGDIGREAPKMESQYEGEGMVDDPDAIEKTEATYTRAQRLNRRRHERRTAAVASTKQEVAQETKYLLAKDKKGELTLEQVDELIARKDAEYEIERDHNINLTGEGTYKDGSPVMWEKDELKEVELTLERLPQLQDPVSVKELRRVKGPEYPLKKGGERFSDHIEITGWGATTSPGFGHGGNKREGVSDEFKKEHGDNIGTLEFVLTHEIGHDVAANDPKAMEAFTKAAGWKKVKVDALRADNIQETDIAKLEETRSLPNAADFEIASTTTTYKPIQNSKDEFWALPRTAVPTMDEQTPSEIVNGETTTKVDTWQYARTDPDEQFAEVYAKAVHVPEKLHDELVDRPTIAAKEAQDRVAKLQAQIKTLKADASIKDRDAKLARLQAQLGEMKQVAAEKELAKQQRGDEFRIMRNDVFHADKATAMALQRLQAAKVSKEKLEEFEKAAARMSTPEQIAMLEKEAMK
jgi:hypothetical protein